MLSGVEDRLSSGSSVARKTDPLSVRKALVSPAGARTLHVLLSPLGLKAVASQGHRLTNESKRDMLNM